jgi:hypothetical protein
MEWRSFSVRCPVRNSIRKGRAGLSKDYQLRREIYRAEQISAPRLTSTELRYELLHSTGAVLRDELLDKQLTVAGKDL